MSVRLVSAMMVSFCLSGCAQGGGGLETISSEKAWGEIERCGGDELCSTAAIVTSSLSKNVGRNLGSGVAIREATTDDRTITLSFDIPDQVTKEKNRSGQTPQDFLQQGFSNKMCSQQEFKRFISLGGSMIIDTYLSSGERFSRSIVTSCA